MTLIFFPVKAEMLDFSFVAIGTFLGTFPIWNLSLKLGTLFLVFKVKIGFQMQRFWENKNVYAVG